MESFHLGIKVWGVEDGSQRDALSPDGSMAFLKTMQCGQKPQELGIDVLLASDSPWDP